MSLENQSASAPRRIVGRVVSNKGDKTITVLVERRVRHPLYGKYVRKSSRLRAHDETNQCHEGDKVAIVETRPISRSKTFRLIEVLETASAAEREQSAVATTGAES